MCISIEQNKIIHTPTVPTLQKVKGLQSKLVSSLTYGPENVQVVVGPGSEVPIHSLAPPPNLSYVCFIIRDIVHSTGVHRHTKHQQSSASHKQVIRVSLLRCEHICDDYFVQEMQEIHPSMQGGHTVWLFAFVCFGKRIKMFDASPSPLFASPFFHVCVWLTKLATFVVEPLRIRSLQGKMC